MRRAVLAGLAALAAAAALTGCGSTASTRITSNSLTVYTSLPLRGERAAQSLAILRGEKLALQESGGRIGGLKVGLVALNDADPKTGTWEPGIAAANARQAARNPTTIAYVGESDSGGTAVSLPITNETGVLQVSPLSSLTGLTRESDKGEPDKYYPSARRTFARLVPDGATEARALVEWLGDEEVKTIAVATDGRQEGLGMLLDLRNALRGTAIQLLEVVRVEPDAKSFEGPVRDLTQKVTPNAVVYLGSAPETAGLLLRAVHAAAPLLPLYATGGVAFPGFAKALGGAGRVVGLTSPIVAPDASLAAVKRFESSYRGAFGVAPPAEAAYGYEAMRSVLQAVRDAGSEGNDRSAIIDAFMAPKRANTVLGDYSIDRFGDTSTHAIGAYSVTGGHIRYDRTLDGGSG